jgi:CheY-specific phosphatase CheX
MFDAVRQTLETMAFVEVTEQSEELELELPPEVCWVNILINDPVQGELRLALPQALLSQMTSDMFGIETEEVTENQRQDIIAEILNTLAGLFMTRLLPDDQTYKLGLPEHGEGPLPEAEEGSIVWKLQVEGSPLLLVANGSSLTTLNN